MEETTHDFRLQANFSLVAIGPSMSGKTSLIINLLENRKEFISQPTTKVLIVYYKLYDQLVSLAESDPDVELYETIEEADKHIIPGCILFIDDAMLELQNPTTLNTVVGYFIRKVHHVGFNCILTLQKCFNKNTKVILDNASYTILFLNCRDKTVITNIGKQFSPTNVRYLQDAYAKATAKPHGYLFLDLRVPTPEKYRVRNFIYPGENSQLYLA